MSVVIWHVVSDSESELVCTNVLLPEEGSSRFHQGLDLESDSVVEWESWVLLGLGVDGPSLVQTIVALVPDNVSVVGVLSSVDVKALVCVVSHVLSVTWVEGGLLVGLVSVLSHDGVGRVSETVSLSSRDGSSSVRGWSDGSGSSVEDEPLSVVP